MLDTLERRRDQMTTKATICLAAASGLLVASFQFILRATPPPSLYLTTCTCILTILLSVISMLSSLRIIKRLSRKRSEPVARHLLFFRTLTAIDANEIAERLQSLDEKTLIEEMSRQLRSLAVNLEKRYQALGWAFSSFVLGVPFLLMSLLSYEVEQGVITLPFLKDHSP